MRAFPRLTVLQCTKRAVAALPRNFCAVIISARSPIPTFVRRPHIMLLPHRRRCLSTVKAGELNLSGMLAEVTDPEVLFEMGVILQNGLEGVEKNAFWAAKFFEHAQEAGNTKAMDNLGYCYLNGIGVSQDEKRAFALFEKSAKCGDSGGMVNLANCYLNGISVERNEELAAKFYEESASLGNSDAMINLGDCYSSGCGVERDEVWAAELYRKSAAMGNTTAKQRLVHLATGLKS